jgi:hypothetical protein
VRPALALTRDLLFESRIRETARQLGVPLRVVREAGALRQALADPPGLVLVDLTGPAAGVEAALATLDGRPPETGPVLAWTTHALWKATRPLHGRADRVLTKEALTAELPELLRAHGAAAGPPGAGEEPMDSEAFVRDLEARNQERLRRLEPEATLAPEVEGDLTVVNLLKVALRNELEATETAARWLVTTVEVDVKLALARQVGDEARHYRLIADRLGQLGFDAGAFDPLARGYGPLFQYLDTLATTVERVAAGQFTREAIAIVKNRQFIAFCEAAGDRETARLYREVIEPDERHHHELGRRLLLARATTPEAQAAARRAAARTLELAEELQSTALRTAGIHHAPGC